MKEEITYTNDEVIGLLTILSIGIYNELGISVSINKHIIYEAMVKDFKVKKTDIKESLDAILS